MKITLENIKKIKKLEFEIPKKGVYLIAGLNGAGKSSLLAALFRIGSRQAFKKHYKAGNFESGLDLFQDSRIIYEVGSKSVVYKYGGQRWRPTPSKNSDLFSEFSYVSVRFVEANGNRIEPFADEIKPRFVKSASPEIKAFMTYVLNDSKWDRLKYVNTRRGIGSEAYLIPYKKNNNTYYYSEKNFSLGELCVLKLACSLVNVKANSLILIDEIEMALHPKAQVNLLEKIKEITAEKNLTTLFSTHSATLIKNIHRQNIIFLKEESQGKFMSVCDVYPAQILGEIAFDDELGADFIFFVEDKQAKYLLEQMLGFYINHIAGTSKFTPLYRVVPVGGYVQVLDLLNASSQIFPEHVRRVAFLDRDVETEVIPSLKYKNQELKTFFDKLKKRIYYLPCTPECGLVEMVETADQYLFEKLNNLFDGSVIDFERMMASPDYKKLNKQKAREKAKDRMAYIVEFVVSKTGNDEVSILRTLYGFYCNLIYGNSMSQLMKLFGPILNRK